MNLTWSSSAGGGRNQTELSTHARPWPTSSANVPNSSRWSDYTRQVIVSVSFARNPSPQPLETMCVLHGNRKRSYSPNLLCNKYSPVPTLGGLWKQIVRPQWSQTDNDEATLNAEPPHWCRLLTLRFYCRQRDISSCPLPLSDRESLNSVPNWT